MALQLGALREALIDAGASPEKAGKAAEEVAAYDSKIKELKSDVKLLKWMVGFNLAMTLAVLWRVFAHGGA